MDVGENNDPRAGLHHVLHLYANLFADSSLGIVHHDHGAVGKIANGLAFFPEFFAEDEPAHKFDEGVLLLLAIGSIVWYLVGKNRFSRTIIPMLFTAAALLMKLLTLFLLEKGDAADLGDESSAIILYVITLAFLIWQYVSIKRMAQASKIETAEALPV